MTLTLKELCALHNLADKQAGEDVDWISIANARALTGLGLARRTRSGWAITSDGMAMVRQQTDNGHAPGRPGKLLPTSFPITAAASVMPEAPPKDPPC
jgi:hypothetical protein